MIQANGYSVHFYVNSQSGKTPVIEYLNGLTEKERAKIYSRMLVLRENEGKAPMPLARYVREGIWELRTEHQKRLHRVLYKTVGGKRILMLHALQKHGDKTPENEMVRAKENLKDFAKHNKSLLYEN